MVPHLHSIMIGGGIFPQHRSFDSGPGHVELVVSHSFFCSMVVIISIHILIYLCSQVPARGPDNEWLRTCTRYAGSSNLSAGGTRSIRARAMNRLAAGFFQPVPGFHARFKFADTFTNFGFFWRDRSFDSGAIHCFEMRVSAGSFDPTFTRRELLQYQFTGAYLLGMLAYTEKMAGRR